MPVQISSTTDSEAAVSAALGNLASKEKVEEKNISASGGEIPDETSEESDTLETADASDEKEDADAKDDNEDAQKDDKPKKKNGFKKRIDKLTRRLTQAEEQINYWRQEALNKSQSQNDQDPKKAEPQGKPNKDDFESHDQYIEALTDWKMDQRLAKSEASKKEVEVKTEYQRQLDDHLKRVDSFKKDHEDWDETIADVDDIPMSVTVQQVILASDNGPELMYALAQNREEYAKICKLSAVEAARALGRFEAQIQKSSDSKSKPEQKKAKPAPLKPVGSNQTGSARVNLNDPNVPFREWEKQREADIAAQRRQRA